MAIRKYKPTTPGRRGSSVADFVEITRTTPEKQLTRPLPKKGGRTNQGRVATPQQRGAPRRVPRDVGRNDQARCATRPRGGGHKRADRVVDFRRYDKDGVPAKVAHI